MIPYTILAMAGLGDAPPTCPDWSTYSPMLGSCVPDPYWKDRQQPGLPGSTCPDGSIKDPNYGICFPSTMPIPVATSPTPVGTTPKLPSIADPDWQARRVEWCKSDDAKRLKDDPLTKSLCFDTLPVKADTPPVKPTEKSAGVGTVTIIGVGLLGAAAAYYIFSGR